MSDFEVRCCDCGFEGEEDDLQAVVVFKETSESELEVLTESDFFKRYKKIENVFSSEIIDACPKCLTDEYLSWVDSIMY